MNIKRLLKSIRSKSIAPVILQSHKFDASALFADNYEINTQADYLDFKLPYKLTLLYFKNTLFQTDNKVLELYVQLSDTAIGITMISFTRIEGSNIFQELPCYGVISS